MNRIKNLFSVFIFLFFLSNCGYTPIFSKKNVNFNINNIEYSGDTLIKAKINNVLSSYTNKSGKEKNVSLLISNSMNKSIASKDSKGEAKIYRVTINTSVKISSSENNYSKKSISKSSTFAAVSSKSEQKLIENKLVENLSNEIAQQIIFEILEKTK